MKPGTLGGAANAANHWAVYLALSTTFIRVSGIELGSQAFSENAFSYWANSLASEGDKPVCNEECLLSHMLSW